PESAKRAASSATARSSSAGAPSPAARSRLAGPAGSTGCAPPRSPPARRAPRAARATRRRARSPPRRAPAGLLRPAALAGGAGVVWTKLVVARSLLLVGELELLLLAGAALSLTARTLASQREEESAIFGSRGAGRRQLVAMALGEALVVTTIAAAAGALLGSR